MSEFTAGVLYLSEDAPVILAQLEGQDDLAFKARPLNDRWSVFFIEDEWLIDPSTLEALLDLSQAAPLLYFYNAEDHGWGYRIMHGGLLLAAFDLSYDLDFNIAMHLARKRYPEVEMFGLEGRSIWTLLLNEVQNSQAFQDAFVDQFRDAHSEAFSLFELDAEMLGALGEILTPEYVRRQDSQWSPVERFKDLVGIGEMSWLGFINADDRTEEFHYSRH